MPIDELIGIRGPLSSLFRNLLWFLAFNTSYLGIFSQIPKTIGSITFYQYSHSRIISKVTKILFEYLLLLPFVNLTRDDDTKATLENVLLILNQETKKRNSILNPRDIAKVLLGYLTMTVSVFLMRRVAQYFDTSSQTQRRSNIHEQRDIHIHDQPVFGERRHEDIFERMDLDEDANSQKLSDLLECVCAMAKVSILIFLKMLLLPLLLGIWLDIATLELFKSCVKDRVISAGVDIVAFFLIHWVVGITFMLMVTVSVLQFREVLHPDLLAAIIRPQESQPDMIANLLQDDGWTHTKRIIPSLAIYAILLTLHVWLPSLIITHYSLDDYLPPFRPKVWYLISEQLQIPIELLAFHLAMLSMLERYKNRIGETQHAFLIRVCNLLQLTDRLLPQSVERFKLRAVIPLRSDYKDGLLAKEILYRPNFDPFWEKLVILHENDGATEDLIESRLQSIANHMLVEERYVMSKISDNGLRADPFHSYIALPIFEKTDVNSPAPVTFAKKLLPPKIGCYRFRKQAATKENQEINIEVWEEVIGEPVRRPPAGWDYMGDNGGAVEQGRWAWEKEPKADVEKFLARRRKLFSPNVIDGEVLRPWRSRNYLFSCISTLFKLNMLVLLSWATVSCCVYGAITIPLVIGRSLYGILGVPEVYTHDPLVFVIGNIIFHPLHLQTLDLICKDRLGTRRVHLISKLVRHFKQLPYRKLVILAQALFLWLLLSPLMLGFSYNLFFLESESFWSMKPLSYLNIYYVLRIWAIGSILIHISVGLCYFKTFRRGFWVRLGRFAFNDLNENNNEAPIINPDDEAEGFIENCVDTLIVILRNGEWDKVDRKMLVDDTSLPLTMILFNILACPTITSFICHKIYESCFQSSK